MTSVKSVFKILLIFSLKSISYNQNSTENSLSTFPETRISGGYRPADLHLEKYIVSLRLRRETDKTFGHTHRCTGSIIGTNKILTAAHCFEDRKSYRYKVVAKTPIRLRKTWKTEEVLVKKIILHPQYENFFFYDIALLVLEKNINLDPKYAAVIQLPKKKIKPGTLCHVAGWGKMYSFGPFANEVLHVELKLHEESFCMKYCQNNTNGKMCASYTTDKQRDTCPGDSGGPLICNGVVAGIVSYGFGCASGHPSFYTNVTTYVDWINANGQEVLKPSVFIILMSFLHI